MQTSNHNEEGWIGGAPCSLGLSAGNWETPPWQGLEECPDDEGADDNTPALEDLMPRCETCGNDYDKAFEVVQGDERHVFDSFECAIATPGHLGQKVRRPSSTA